MKSIFILIFLLYIAVQANMFAQSVITPIWYAPGVGYSALFNSDCSKIMTNGSGCSIWESKTGKMLFHLNAFGITFSLNGDSVICRKGDSLVLYNSNDGKQIRAHKVFNTSVDRIIFNSKKNMLIFWKAGDPYVRIWNMQTEEVHATLRADFFYVSGVGFNRDGDKVFTAGHKDGVRIWDVETAEMVVKLQQTDLHLESPSFSIRGDKVSATNNTNSVKVWSTESGKLLTTITQEKIRFERVYFDNSGEKLVTISSDSALNIWDAKTGELFKEVSRSQTERINSVVFNRNGDKLYVLGDSSVKAWSFPEGNLLFSSDVSECALQHISLSDDNTKIIVSDKCGYAKVLDVNDGSVLLTLTGHVGGRFAEFSDDGQKILVSNYEPCAKIWNTHNHENRSFMRFPNIQGEIVDFKGRYFVVRVASGDIIVYDIENADIRSVIRGNNWIDIGLMKLSNYSEKIACKSSANEISIGDVLSGVVFHKLNLGKEVRNFRFSPDDKYLLASGHDSTARIWDVETGIVKTNITTKGRFLSFLEINTKGDRALIASSGGMPPTIYDIETGKKLIECTFPSDPISTISFNKLGDKIVAGCYDGSATVWNSNTGKVLFTTNGHSSRLRVAQFNNRGDKLVTGDMEGKLNLWSAIDGKLIAELKGHRGIIMSAEFDPFDSKLLTTDETIAMWDIAQFPVEVSDDTTMLSEDFTLYPNPSDTHISIDSPFSHDISECTIIDVMGRIVLAQSVEANHNTIKIPINNLQTGFYSIRIKSSGKEFISNLIVKR